MSGLFKDSEIINLLSDEEDFPLHTSTQVPVRPPKQTSRSKARDAVPVIVESFEDEDDEIILLDSSPVQPKSPVRRAPPPKAKKNTALLDQLINMSESDDDESFNLRPVVTKKKATPIKKVTPVRRKESAPVASSSSSPIILDSPQKPAAPTRRNASFSESFSESPIPSPRANSPYRGSTTFSPAPRYLTTKETSLSKMTADDLKNMMKKLDSSRDSIVDTSQKSLHRSPLFVPDSSFGPRTTSKPSRKSSSDMFVHDSDSDSDNDAPLGVRAPPQLESVDDESDNDVEISEHNILLSSSPMKRGIYDVDEVINQSSSIGEIRESNAPSKPRISIEKLKKPSEPIYKFDKSKEKSNASNPFLNKLLTKNTKERLSHEELLKKREAEKRAKEIAKSKQLGQREPSPLRYTSKASKTPAPIVRSSSEATPNRPSASINWADYTFDSDDDDDFTLPKFNSEPTTKSQRPPVQAYSGVNPLAPAKRSGTESNVVNSKEARALAKATREKDKLTLKKNKEANKVTRSKVELLGEMIIDAPKMFMDLVRRKECEKELEGIQVKESPKLDSYIHWQRKVTSTYDKATDSFIPSEPYVLDEDKCCFVFNASELVLMMEMETLLTTFVNFRRQNKKFKNFIILIMELGQLLNKLRAKENREYRDTVRAQMAGGEAPTATKKRKKNTEPELSLQEMEETIAQLQVNGFKVFPAKNPHEATVWLRSFTYAIAQARYDKLERNPEFNNIGTIRSGKGAADTYTRILLQLKFMTEPRVKRVTNAVPTFRELFDHAQRGRLPSGDDGKTIMNSNVQAVVMKLLTTRDDDELIHEG